MSGLLQEDEDKTTTATSVMAYDTKSPIDVSNVMVDGDIGKITIQVSCIL